MLSIQLLRSRRFTQQAEHLIDQLFQTLTFELNAVEFINNQALILVPGYFKRHAQTCQRRAQFMADIPQQTLVGLLRYLQAPGHFVHVPSQLPEFIISLVKRCTYPGRQITGGQLFAGPAQLPQWGRQVTGQQQAYQGTDDSRHPQSHPYPTWAGGQQATRLFAGSTYQGIYLTVSTLYFLSGNFYPVPSQLFQYLIPAQQLAALRVNYKNMVAHSPWQITQFTFDLFLAALVHFPNQHFHETIPVIFKPTPGFLYRIALNHRLVDPADHHGKGHDAQPQGQKQFPE